MTDQIDPRRAALKRGLRQLQPYQLQRLLEHIDAGKPLLLDRDAEGRANFSEGVYCPLAVATKMDEMYGFLREVPTNEGIEQSLLTSGFEIYNTRGVAGEYYTTDRRADLRQAVVEVIAEGN